MKSNPTGRSKLTPAAAPPARKAEVGTPGMVGKRQF